MTSNRKLIVSLEIQDDIIIKYLEGFAEIIRNAKAIEAMKVGVIAIQSASPSLDTKIVEEKFREIKGGIDNCIATFDDNLKFSLENYFKDQSGSVPRSLDKLFGNSGSLSVLFAQYFGPKNSHVNRLIEEQIGPSSAFAKSLDPANKESVICKIEDSVKKHLETKIKEIVDHFSLDIEGSALSRLKSAIANEVKEIRNINNKFFTDLKEALAIKTGKREEAEKGTEKGREFETILYDYFAQLGYQLGDSTENVRGIIGVVAYSKKGDYIGTMSATSGSPGSKIVVEAKMGQGYKLKDAIDELKDAKENRGATVGILAFAKGYEPPEVGDFLFIGNDFFVTIDGEAMVEKKPLLYLDAAYKIGRALIVTAAQKDEACEIDFGQIKREISSLIESISRLSDLSKKAKTISKNSKDIEDTIDELKIDMEKRLNNVSDILKRKNSE